MSKGIGLALSVGIPLAATVIFQPGALLAGPPLLCQPIEIGKAQSLPWGEGAWSNDQIKLSDAEFVALTLELLSADAGMLTRMETIRRAAVHAAERPTTAGAMLTSLRERLVKPDGRGDSDARFNLGYMLATFEQMNIVADHNARGVSGRRRSELTLIPGLDAYALVKEAAMDSERRDEIEFALALMTAHPRHPSHSEHLQNAMAAAENGTLLAVNLINHFGGRGETLSDLRSRYGTRDEPERR